MSSALQGKEGNTGSFQQGRRSEGSSNAEKVGNLVTPWMFPLKRGWHRICQWCGLCKRGPHPTDGAALELREDDQQWCCTPKDPLREALYLSTAPGVGAGFKCQPAVKAPGIP